MKLLNIDPSGQPLSITDIGNIRRIGQNRYIPSGLSEGIPDNNKAIQLIETREVLRSAASGQIAMHVSTGKIKILCSGENIEKYLQLKRINNTHILLSNFIFERPIICTRLQVSAQPNSAHIGFIFKVNHIIWFIKYINMVTADIYISFPFPNRVLFPEDRLDVELAPESQIFALPYINLQITYELVA